MCMYYTYTSIIFFGAVLNPRVGEEIRSGEWQQTSFEFGDQRGKPRKVQPTSDEDDTDSNLGFSKLLNIMCMYLYMYLYMMYACLYIYVHDAPHRSVPL